MFPVLCINSLGLQWRWPVCIGMISTCVLIHRIPNSRHPCPQLMVFVLDGDLAPCFFISLCTMWVWYLQRPEDSIRSPGTGVTDSCKLPCEYWESNPCLLVEQPVFLITELSLFRLGPLLGALKLRATGWPTCSSCYSVYAPVRKEVRLRVFLSEATEGRSIHLGLDSLWD